MENQVILQNGMDVYGADDAKLGSIHEVRGNYIVIEKGFFFPKDYYIPVSAIEGVDPDNRVYLNVTKDVALNQGWDMVPEDEFASTTGYSTTGQAANMATGATASTESGGYGDAAYGQTETSEVISPDYVADVDRAATGGDTTRVPVYEEEITPVKRSVDRGAVRIEKELVTEERTITVPVTEERVRVTQVDTNEAVGANAGDVFEEGVIEVPLRGEEVDVQKTARKTGEVIVEKEAVQRDQQVGGTVRREEVRVDDETVQSADTPRRNRS